MSEIIKSEEDSVSSTSVDVDYLDHSVVVTVTDLNGLYDTYEALGFTLTPRSTHTGTAQPDGERQSLGTANRCAVFGENYIELLGHLDSSLPDPWGVRRLAAAYEGLRGYVFGCGDADHVDRRLAEQGVSTTGVLMLQRDIPTPDGVGTLRARVIQVDPPLAPEGGVRIAEVQGLDLIHQPRFLDHPNGAVGLSRVTLVVADEETDRYVERYRKVLGIPARQIGPRHVFALRVGGLEIVPLSALDEILPGEKAPTLPYVAAQTVAVNDLGRAKSVIEGNGFAVRPLPGGFFVSADDTRGANLVFEARA